MKENVQIKLLAYKKGTPMKAIKRLAKAIELAWEETLPGGKLICIPVENEREE